MASIFFDIDGTLIDRYGVVEQSTIKAVDRLKENGHAVYINSGRTKVYIHNKELLEMPFDGMLCGCGTNLFLHGEELFCRNIERDLLYHMVEAFNRFDLPMIIEGRDWLYMDHEKIGRDPYGESVFQKIRQHAQPIAGNEHIEASKFSVVTQYIEPELADQIMDEFRDLFTIANHDYHVMELTPKDCSKAIAMLEICRHTGVSREETFAFGDGANDVEMLKAAGTGIVMGNGRKPAKDVADYITDDIHEDGIWNALSHFGLI